jgi:hypothetical protein
MTVHASHRRLWPRLRPGPISACRVQITLGRAASACATRRRSWCRMACRHLQPTAMRCSSYSLFRIIRRRRLRGTDRDMSCFTWGERLSSSSSTSSFGRNRLSSSKSADCPEEAPTFYADSQLTDGRSLLGDATHRFLPHSRMGHPHLCLLFPRLC